LTFGQLAAFVEQWVNLTTRRLATKLADLPAYCAQEAQFGVDGVKIAHGAEA
jgi:hypothetical protein